MARGFFRKFMMRRFTVLLASLLACLPITVLAGSHSASADAPTVLITGGNRGLGLEFVRQYAADGWRVIATARRPEAADQLQALAQKNPLIIIEQLDVRDLPAIDALAAKYAERPIDVLLNNAALSGSPSPKQMFRRLDFDLFNAFMETNARGPLKMSEAFLKHVQASEQKKIVVITSKGGLFSQLDSMAFGTYFYRASKAAVNMLMVQVAADVKKRGITVVLLNPGLVDTQDRLTQMNEKMKLGLTLVPIQESVAGLRNMIDTLPPEESGVVHQWSGERLDY
jgi:NAD(P)-dependent dehydrogenase (short-subunit alcohol dehydrogenase family)